MPSLVDMAASRIAEQTAPQPSSPYVRWRWGTVAAVNSDGTMDVEVGGSTMPSVRALASAMIAQVGDRVRVDYLGTDAVVTGVRATSAGESLPLLAFRECATESTSISSGSCVEVSATIPTVEGYTRRGIIQTWTTGTGNTVVGSQSCSGSKAYAKVRANNASQVVVHFYVLYEYTG